MARSRRKEIRLSLISQYLTVLGVPDEQVNNLEESLRKLTFNDLQPLKYTVEFLWTQHFHGKKEG